MKNLLLSLQNLETQIQTEESLEDKLKLRLIEKDIMKFMLEKLGVTLK